MINRIPIFNINQCDDISRRLFLLKNLWIERYRSQIIRFSTLGFASYLDQKTNEWDVIARNDIITENFSDVLDQVKSALLPILGSFEFEKTTPIPGFHIFETLENGVDTRETRIHIDIPYLKYNFGSRYTDIDYQNTINFTLCIELPSNGGGINMWNHIEDPIHFQSNYDNIVKDLKNPEYFAYNRGELSYFFGYPIHQIAKKPTIEGDRRITLQGHGIKCDNKWIIYF